MFSTNIQTVITLVVITLIFVSMLLSLTDTGKNVASVIMGIDNQTTNCIQALPLSKRNSDYTLTKKHLNTDSTKDIILTATSKDQCGSAGCTHELCLIKDNDVEIVSFGYTAETLIVKDMLSNGMHDITLLGRSTTNLQWDGDRYRVLQ